MRYAPSLDGSETIHSVLNSFAEFTGTICYVSYENRVRFRGMNSSGDLTDVLTADDYIDLSVGEVVYLTKLISATELGDNISVGTDGHTQILWNNPFFATRDDPIEIIDTIANNTLSLSNTYYKLEWRGCPAYEMGDMVILQEKDGSAQYVRYLNETLEFTGGLRSSSEWETGEEENVNAAPVTIGERLNQTLARVDKVNNEVELLTSKVEQIDPDNVQEELSSLKLTTDSITAQVQQIETTNDEQNQTIQSLTHSVEQTMSAENIQILIQNELAESDVTSVTTSTGFTFDEEGLTINKTNSEMSTQLTEDGMTITRNKDIVLTVNNVGVDAKNLHATTYLFIGDTSRFEDYVTSDNKLRTGCFWIRTEE